MLILIEDAFVMEKAGHILRTVGILRFYYEIMVNGDGRKKLEMSYFNDEWTNICSYIPTAPMLSFIFEIKDKSLLSEKDSERNSVIIYFGID